jgi:hypothetical protein
VKLSKVRPWLTRLYPRLWRERYGTEFDALLDQCLRSSLDLVDIVLGAVDAHLQLMKGENLNWRILDMLNKLRTTILIVFSAYIGFIIAGFSLVGLADDSPMITLMKTYPVLKASWMTIQIGAVIALLAVVVGGLPLALTVIRQTWRGNKRSLRLLVVPVIAFMALVLYLVFVFSVTTGRIYIPGIVKVVSPDNFPVGNKLLIAGIMLVFILGAVASTWAVWKVISGTDVEQEKFKTFGKILSIKIYNFAFAPAVVTTTAMVIVLIATIAWGVMAFTSLPDIFYGNYGVFLTSTQVWFYGIVILMGLCCAAAIFGLMRSRTKSIR